MPGNRNLQSRQFGTFSTRNANRQELHRVTSRLHHDAARIMDSRNGKLRDSGNKKAAKIYSDASLHHERAGQHQERLSRELARDAAGVSARIEPRMTGRKNPAADASKTRFGMN